MIRKPGLMRNAIAIFAAAVLMLSCGSVYAVLTPIIIDVSGAGLAGTADDVNTLTGPFTGLGLYAETTSSPDFYGAWTFKDVGDLKVTQLLPPDVTRDDEGLGAGGWELTGRWEDLRGIYTAPVLAGSKYVSTYYYTAGTLDLWVDGTPDADFNSVPFGSLDDNAPTFVNDTKVATLSLIGAGSEGHLWFSDALGTQPVSGDTLTYWDFTWLKPGFWYSQSLVDLSYVLEELPLFKMMGEVDTNTHQIYINDLGVHSAHDGSASIDTTIIPEPASILLMGIGLLKLISTGIRRRRNIA